MVTLPAPTLELQRVPAGPAREDGATFSHYLRWATSRCLRTYQVYRAARFCVFMGVPLLRCWERCDWLRPVVSTTSRCGMLCCCRYDLTIFATRHGSSLAGRQGQGCSAGHEPAGRAGSPGCQEPHLSWGVGGVDESRCGARGLHPDSGTGRYGHSCQDTGT